MNWYHQATALTRMYIIMFSMLDDYIHAMTNQKLSCIPSAKWEISQLASCPEKPLFCHGSLDKKETKRMIILAIYQ